MYAVASWIGIALLGFFTGYYLFGSIFLAGGLITFIVMKQQGKI